jgi:hypothetical protein
MRVPCGLQVAIDTAKSTLYDLTGLTALHTSIIFISDCLVWSQALLARCLGPQDAFDVAFGTSVLMSFGPRARFRRFGGW